MTNLEPIVTTEIKPTIVKKEGVKEFERREGEVNPEYESEVHEKKSLGTKIKELFTGPTD